MIFTSQKSKDIKNVLESLKYYQIFEILHNIFDIHNLRKYLLEFQKSKFIKLINAYMRQIMKYPKYPQHHECFEYDTKIPQISSNTSKYLQLSTNLKQLH